MAAALGALGAGVAAAFGSGWAAGLATAFLGFRCATGSTAGTVDVGSAADLAVAALGATGFATAGLAAAAFAFDGDGVPPDTFGFGKAAGLAVAAFGFGGATRFAAAAFDLACFAVAGFTTAGFVAAGFLAPGFLPAGFAATMSLGGAELEAARTSEASGDAAFDVAFTVSSLGPSLGSACSALGRRG